MLAEFIIWQSRNEMQKGALLVKANPVNLNIPRADPRPNYRVFRDERLTGVCKPVWPANFETLLSVFHKNRG